MKIHGLQVEEGVEGAVPGTVLETRGEGPLVAAGEGAVRLLNVQPAGKKVMSGAAYLRGHGLKAGDQLG